MLDNNFTVNPTNLEQTIKNIVTSIDKGYELQNMVNTDCLHSIVSEKENSVFQTSLYFHNLTA